MDKEVIERALAECGGNLDSVIRSLTQLGLGSAAADLPSQQEVIITPGSGDSAAQDGGLPKNNSEWVDMFMREMMSASTVDDGKARVSRLLEALETSNTENSQKENVMLKQQMETVIRENIILKRAVSIQHERQKEYERGVTQEMQQLKQLVAHYQEQLRTVEVNSNLATQCNNPIISGHFGPSVF